jgi:diguanylate cyclase (GGDEF)-like protein
MQPRGASRMNRVMFLDIEFFKQYDDICGHLAGDTALQRVAQVVLSSCRQRDIVYR